MLQMIRIALRNISRPKKRSILLGSAIAFGFLVITLVNGFTGGLLKTTKENLSHLFGGHIYISGSIVSPLGSELPMIQDSFAAEEAIKAISDRVASVQYRSKTTGTLYFGNKEQTQKLEGVDFAAEQSFRTNIDISKGSLADIDKPGSLILPEATAKKLGVEIGETLLYRASTVTGQQNIGEFTLIATTTSSSVMVMDTGYTSKAYLNTLIGLDEGDYQSINIFLKDVAEVQTVADRLYSNLASNAPVSPRISADSTSSPRNMSAMRSSLMGMNQIVQVAKEEQWKGTKFSVTTIEDLMSPILSLLSIIQAVAFLVFIILLVIIMVGIMNSYRMVMIERTEEIGTMRALGVQKSGIRTIFFTEALSEAVLGTASGFVLALLIGGILSLINFGSGSFLSLFLARGHFVLQFSIPEALKNMLIICVMSIMAVYLPARSAANLEPAQALRATY
jgi:ABC-type transport system, involved in lipoprotein release, permease component